MSDIYTRSQAMASRLMSRYGQGVVEYVVTEEEPGAEPWDPPTVTEARLPMDATVQGVQSHRADSLVTMDDLVVTCSVFGVEPVVGGIVEIDGDQHQVLRVERIPSAGTVVAWRLFVKA